MLLYRRARIRPGTAGIGSLSKHQPHSLPIRKERINPQRTQMKNPKKIICENLCNLRTKNLLRCFPLPPLFQICPPVEISGKKGYIVVTGESVDCASYTEDTRPLPGTAGSWARILTSLPIHQSAFPHICQTRKTSRDHQPDHPPA